MISCVHSRGARRGALRRRRASWRSRSSPPKRHQALGADPHSTGIGREPNFGATQKALSDDDPNRDDQFLEKLGFFSEFMEFCSLFCSSREGSLRERAVSGALAQAYRMGSDEFCVKILITIDLYLFLMFFEQPEQERRRRL